MNKFNLAMALMLLVILIVIAYRNTTESFQVTSLNNADLIQGVVPGGTIVAWCHDATIDNFGRLEHNPKANIPDGWVVCDGRTYTKTDKTRGYTPNLVGKFIYGSRGLSGTNIGYANVANDNSYWNTIVGPGGDESKREYKGGGVGDRGDGLMYRDSAGKYTGHQNQTKPGAMGGNRMVMLKEAEMPRHSHYVAYAGNDVNKHTGNKPSFWTASSKADYKTIVASRGVDGDDRYDYAFWGTNENANLGESSLVGNGQAHGNMPPYYSLIYIMKKY